MPIFVSQIKSEISQSERSVVDRTLALLSLSQSEVRFAGVSKRSLDARRRENIHYVNTVKIELFDEKDERKVAQKSPHAVYKPRQTFEFEKGTQKPNGNIVITGFGPAGMFASLVLAENGYNPIVLERGPGIEKRVCAVEQFLNKGELDENANVQFGEGGAGTFSDGKLTTRISDPLCEYVLNEFVKHGAPEDILIKAKPHIGTDRLRVIVSSIRSRIMQLGGEIMFESCLDDIKVKGSAVAGVSANNTELNACAVVLAAGHSARDTFSMLYGKGIMMQPKPFSVGVRIEQRQEVINRGLYGKYADDKNLPVGEYQLSYHEGGRAVYTFCMCPGGVVVPSCSEQETVVTNGMSEYARDKENANAGLVVSVSEKDFDSGPLGGISFQRRLEKRAFELGGKSYRAPCATVDCFMNGEKGINIGSVKPSYSIGVTGADFSELFGHEINNMLKIGIDRFNKRLPEFATPDAVLTGAETRTSSPVRILRNEETGESVTISGLYPCGEGAGYAGGIMSAAVDGIKIAAKIMKKYAPYN